MNGILTSKNSRTKTTIPEALPDSQNPTIELQASPYISHSLAKNESGLQSAIWHISARPDTARFYSQPQANEYLWDEDPEFDLEMQAWDMLSDEALENFERELD